MNNNKDFSPEYQKRLILAQFLGVRFYKDPVLLTATYKVVALAPPKKVTARKVLKAPVPVVLEQNEKSDSDLPPFVGTSVYTSSAVPAVSNNRHQSFKLYL